MIYTQDSQVKKIVEKAFPEYGGKKIRVDSSFPTNLNSYWCDGSRDYFVFVNLDTMETKEVLSNHPYFEKDRPRVLDVAGLPPNIVLVEKCIFAGKELHCTVYAKPEVLSPMLPDNTIELTQFEKIVLLATRGLKSAFRVENSKRDTGITTAEYETALNNLINKGLLKANKSITDKGYNTLESLGLTSSNLCQLRIKERF
jgi:hypothetical protein